ncbi:MAG: hypothetical protein GWP06_11350 [Actinobacteria bacterium]|nr:hypothetical protein [Actinomycetota bacterium]
MTEKNKNMLIGILIIFIGILALLINMNVIPNAQDFVGGMFFLIVAYLFYRLYQKKRVWWPLLLALFFACIGVVLVIQNFVYVPDNIIGAAFFWCGAVVFAYLYVKNKRRWWALLSAGTCVTLGTIVLIDAFHLLSGDQDGVVFFLGLGLSFMLLYLQRNSENKLDWAIYPGAASLLLALFLYFQNVDWMSGDYFLPIVLILVGGFLIFRASRRPKTSAQSPGDEAWSDGTTNEK